MGYAGSLLNFRHGFSIDEIKRPCRTIYWTFRTFPLRTKTFFFFKIVQGCTSEISDAFPWILKFPSKNLNFKSNVLELNFSLKLGSRFTKISIKTNAFTNYENF